MNDISIDLETLSTRHDAAVLSIGAVFFDRTTGEIGEKLYVEVDVDSAIATGHVLGSTLGWWMKQNEQAKALFDGHSKPHLAEALHMLTKFVRRHDGAKVWGNGATFDITILEHAYIRLGLPVPWKYWDVRDMRTIVEAATAMGFDKHNVSFEGIRHNAADDAAHQARVIASGCAFFCGPSNWQPMATAPKDGTMLHLLVGFTDNATEDSAEPCSTIGANSFDNTGIDNWQFAGWNWQQDCFTEGIGAPVGWLPLAVATTANSLPHLARIAGAALDGKATAANAGGLIPIDMILHCPACQLQHIDAPDERTADWKNEAHRSHLCHGCGHIWRPADVPTNGVKTIQTKGKADSPAAEKAGDLSPLDYRAQGREEALAVILALDAETQLDDFVSSSALGDSGDYTTHWNEDKLRELLHIGDRTHDAYDRAEAAYWDALGHKEEAKREMLLVEQAPFYKPLSEFLSKHKAWDLMGSLKCEAARPTAVGAGGLKGGAA